LVVVACVWRSHVSRSFIRFAEATITKPLQEIGLPPRKKPFGPKVHVKEVAEGDVEDDSEDSTAGKSQKGRRKPLAVEYVEKLLDMRLKRFETADELLRGLELEKKARTEEVCPWARTPDWRLDDTVRGCPSGCGPHQEAHAVEARSCR
jgi:hypothetical protein